MVNIFVFKNNEFTFDGTNEWITYPAKKNKSSYVDQQKAIKYSF